MLIKRILCGLCALGLMLLGIKLLGAFSQVWQFLGGFSLIGGITLAYVAVMQGLPNYNFWVTLAAIGLAYAWYNAKYQEDDTDFVTAEQTLQQEAPLTEATSEDGGNKVSSSKPVQKKRKSTGFNLSSYPKISGSATVIHAHLFYIGGRYVRLFGVDAPDSDQICSDAAGRTYNCGETAASWVRGWIDNNPIDCYLLKVEPQGQDLATCVWGEYDVGAALVSAGWGIANTKESDIYRPYEAKAKSESSGLWQGTFYSPEDWRDIKRRKNDFTIKRTIKKSGGFFSSWF